MIVVAIAALTLAAFCVVGAFGVVRWCWRTLERANRVHAEQTAKLLDRAMHVVNKTWEPPPYTQTEPEEKPDDPYEGIIRDPEQTVSFPGSELDELDRQMLREAALDRAALDVPAHFRDQRELDEVV